MEMKMKAVISQNEELAIELGILYAERNQCIALIISMAKEMKYKIGYNCLAESEGSYIVIVEFPIGQWKWIVTAEDWDTIPLFRELKHFDGIISDAPNTLPNKLLA